MAVIFIRTLLVYIFLLISMRIMGKRQIGQLEVTDFVTTLLLSEIASLPIENPDIPIVNALIPIVILLTFEVTSSLILSKSQKLKNIFSARPGFLIEKGRINQKEMTKNRISIDELMSELRQKEISEISEVEYAIIEQDGKLTVIPKSQYKAVSPKVLGLSVSEEGISHIIISNGVLNSHSLSITGKSSEWVRRVITASDCTVNDIFLMTLSDSGKINIIKKERKRKQ